MLSDRQLLRYSRHILLPQMALEGQESLLNSRVAVIGLGGLGSAAALYLAASGVGYLRLIDFDHVEESNLQRQVIHSRRQVGQRKVDSAKQALAALNEDIQIEVVPESLTEQNAPKLLNDLHLIVDCSDNFNTRFLINRLSIAMKIPLVSGAAIRMEAQISVFDPRSADGPCYRCLYTEGEDVPLSCSESGVLSPLVGVMGSMQALEAVKILANIGQPLIGRLQIYDAALAEWRTLKLNRDPECPECQKKILNTI